MLQSKKGIQAMENKMNEKLSEQVVGILISAVLIQILDIIAVISYSQLRNTWKNFALGLWIGTISAIIMAAMVYRAIPHALKMEPEKADRYMKLIYAARALLMLIVAAIVYYFHIGYVMAAFLGMLCLQFGGIFQPFIHIFFSGEEDDS